MEVLEKKFFHFEFFFFGAVRMNDNYFVMEYEEAETKSHEKRCSFELSAVRLG